MKTSRAQIYDLLFILVLLAAAFFRFTGINWDQSQHLHPDERFMSMVESGISPVKSLSDYFNTDTSTLNPHNVGYTFYVYGDLPIIMVRYIAEAMSSVSEKAAQYVADHGTSGVGQIFAILSQHTNWAGYDEVTYLGRVLSGLADLGTIFLLYLIAARIYGRKVALLAAAFSAVAVMQIQQSHFFTVDNFANFFIFLTIYFGVEVGFARPKPKPPAPVVETPTAEAVPVEGEAVEVSLPDGDMPAMIEESEAETTSVEGEAAEDYSPEDGDDTFTQTAESPESITKPSGQDEMISSVLRSALFWNVVGFGIALGMAVASKLNAAPLAILLPVALITRYFRMRRQLAVISEQSSVNSDQLAVNSDQLAVNSDQSAVISDQLAVNSDQLAVNSDHQPLNTDHQPLNTPLFAIKLGLVLLLLGAVLSVVSFRVFQPYAFRGPGFFNVSLNQKWVDNIKEQADNNSGDVDSPPALQWANRSKLYSLQNLVEWGLGWPLGILACLGLLYMAWRILKGEGEHVLLWIWTALYLTWQSLQWNPTMRYQLPIYPLMALMAAWLVFEIAKLKIERPKPRTNDLPDIQPSDLQPFDELRAAPSTFQPSTFINLQPLALSLGALVLIATTVWAIAFIHIYMVDHSRVQATRWIYENIPGPFNLEISQPDGSTYSQLMPYQSGPVSPSTPYETSFTARTSGTLQSILVSHAIDPTNSGEQTVMVSLSPEPGGAADKTLATAKLTAALLPQPDSQGTSYTLKFDHPTAVVKDQQYFLRFTTTGSFLMIGAVPINESTWDDGLPLRMDNYDPYGGLYQGEHNFEMYWDDNIDKLNRFTGNLDSGDYIFISSNRQWGTTTRIPERYPLTTAFYRNLINCPDNKDVITCYNEATPETYKGGALGYDLIKVFESFPTFGPWRINDQFADEAFTVYDHPKILIFKKRPDYDAGKVHTLLTAVDISNVPHITPLKAANYRSLMLPEAKREADIAGGTWADLYSYEWLQNKFPILGLLVWYLSIAVLGWLTYLFLRLFLPGLPDRGYPLAKLSGLLLLAYFSWIVGSLGGEYSRLTIAIGFGLILLTGLAAAWFKRDEVLAEIRAKSRYFLSIEGIFLAFFVIDLLIRFGNPDLWHPGKGGERPMDFAYLNAVLKSSSFPPYDPWFAGGYINYYYWGFVLVATPIKLLGIVPSLAFNFVLPTLFALLAIGGFSVAWNLAAAIKKPEPDEIQPENPIPAPPPTEEIAVEAMPAEVVVDEDTGTEDMAAENTEPEITDAEKVAAPVIRVPQPWISAAKLPWLSGLLAGAGLVLIGNLGTVRMFYEGLQRMVVDNDTFNNPSTSIFTHLNWALQGLPKLLNGQTFPYYPGDWYWIPSRAISTPAGSEITEFPLFTFLYSDLHAHMLALPLTVLVIAWALSVLMLRKSSLWTWLGALAFGGLAIGALRPTNTWDFPTYLALGAIVAGYAIFRYADVGDQPRLGIHPIILRILLALAGMGLLAGFSLALYQPFANWFAQGYTSLKPWTELRSPVDQYLWHWGLFLFIIASWLLWETIEWLAVIPLSALSKLKPYTGLIWVGVVALVLVFLLMVVGTQITLPGGTEPIYIGFNVGIAWIAVPLLFLALALMLRPDQSDVKRLVLFMIATGLAITIFVEVAVLDGDIGRMNTIFKFYLQVWVMFAISSAAAVGWIVAKIHTWSPNWRNIWSVVGGILLLSALMFTIAATSEKISDRMTPGAVPPTLDSIDYMKYAHYSERDKDMDLSQDYRAIRWIQDNVKGSPVILEGAPAGVQYTWFSRYSIYTGLPTVVGWQWHQEQQRVVMPNGIVAARGQEAQGFYRTGDLTEAQAFLKKYDVRYIVVGQLERAAFPEGLAKFDEQDGALWQAVYRDGETVIYQVLQ